MPDPRQGAAAAVANIIAAIDQLDERERQRLYVQLLASRGPPPTSTRPGQAATVLPNAATILPSPVSNATSPATRVRTYLAESGVSGKDTAPDFTGIAASIRKLITIAVYDPTGLAGTELRRGVQRLVETALNGLDATPSLAKRGIVFELQWVNRDLRAQERTRFGPMQCPVYLADDDKSGSNIIKIIDEHRYPKLVPYMKFDIRQHARDEWGGGLRGTAVPPGLGRAYNRMIFLKKSIFTEGDRMGNKTLITNALLHEFGHVCNITTHATDGTAMATRLTTQRMIGDVLPYRPGDRDKIVREVERLWMLQKSLSS
ncbi:MAG: hypothetical protein JNK64_11045 [Myxococcales bacterium]|nr:hypothetical protein [Myxococcales bacterium]